VSSRHLIAYLLLILLLGGIAAAIWWSAYNSERSVRRARGANVVRNNRNASGAAMKKVRPIALPDYHPHNPFST